MGDPDAATRAGRFLAEHAHYDADIPFWRELAARQGGPVLDLGAAAGRVAIPLARDGHEVWALDSDPAMLAELAGAAGREDAGVAARVRPVRGDLRRLDLPGRFPLVLLAMNTLQVLLTPGDQVACLAGVRRHLAPGGLLAFDVALPDIAEVQSTLGVLRATGVHHDAAGGATLFHSAVYDDFDPVSQTLEFTLFVDERGRDGRLARHVRPHRVHLYLPAELRHLVARAGLAVAEEHGGFDGEPLSPASERQVYVCRAAEVAP